MPPVLQRTASLNTRRGQGFSTAKHRPTVQRIIVANRAAAQEVPQPLHDSYSEIDYTPRYKK
ncbi:hypothetical protein C2E20_7006 [Micractinium conductrix]|uniref:Uncharacterized protein n=1 Tax=Micractinium conductrix TaxID=554055 RepID=A0A2P6V5Z2_9CHLO|nr:hypothetical protein C2E20_7006 [Micractinium conductrix]|eukprot:PSC69504.1 hypothetical protein C2E20_7006 [Micractinium conductrix]